MDVELVLDQMSSIEKKYSVDMTDATSDEARTQIEAKIGKERYKAMKMLDKNNERASPK